jgi:hypothetical protein
VRARILVVIAAVAACLGTALVAVPLTHADAVGSAFSYRVLDMCSDDADGKECVVSATRNGVPITSNYPTGVGSHEWFYVDNGWRNGIWSFNLNTITIPPSGPPTASKFVDVTADWVITVNTGSYAPRELNSKTQNTTFTRGGNATDGYTFTISFNPVPIAWRFYDNTFTCDSTGCGDNTTQADFVSGPGQGDSDGYVSDLADSPYSSRYVYSRTGFVTAGNAQYQAEPYYDADTNSLVVQLANPHLRSADPTDTASGFFEAFLPDSYLTTQLSVPDPSTLTGGSVTVQRLGTTTATPFTLTHTAPGADIPGVWIKVHNVGFSRPRYKITPKPSVPGKPRPTSVLKLTGGQAKIYFKAPLANGGRSVDRYSARCRKYTTSAWHSVAGTKSPLTVTGLPSGKVYCQVRAHNSVGWGSFSSLWGSHS